MAYRNAFNCKKCPQTNGENGCPCWWEIPWENEQTGEIQYKKGCVLSMEISLPIVQALIRAVNRSSEHASVARNTFDQGIGILQQQVQQAINQFGGNHNDPAIED